MSEMVERVARAICASTDITMAGGIETVMDNPDFIIPANSRADRKPLARWRLYVPQARAAIEAMREPTDLMDKAGRFYGGSESRDVWVAMIDAALEEGG